MTNAKLARTFLSTSYVFAGIVAFVCVIDLALGVPFGQAILMDSLLIVAAGIVAYLAFDASQDLRS